MRTHTVACAADAPVTSSAARTLGPWSPRISSGPCTVPPVRSVYLRDGWETPSGLRQALEGGECRSKAGRAGGGVGLCVGSPPRLTSGGRRASAAGAAAQAGGAAAGGVPTREPGQTWRCHCRLRPRTGRGLCRGTPARGGRCGGDGRRLGEGLACAATCRAGAQALCLTRTHGRLPAATLQAPRPPARPAACRHPTHRESVHSLGAEVSVDTGGGQPYGLVGGHQHGCCHGGGRVVPEHCQRKRAARATRHLRSSSDGWQGRQQGRAGVSGAARGLAWEKRQSAQGWRPLG